MTPAAPHLYSIVVSMLNGTNLPINNTQATVGIYVLLNSATSSLLLKPTML